MPTTTKWGTVSFNMGAHAYLLAGVKADLLEELSGLANGPGSLIAERLQLCNNLPQQVLQKLK